MEIARHSTASVNYEYGCDLRRLYPWPGVVDPLYWGAAIASVRPGESTTLDQHDEHETFIILSGKGSMQIDEATEILEQGDVVKIPKNAPHLIANLDNDQPLVFISIFWDSPRARDETLQMLQGARAITD